MLTTFICIVKEKLTERKILKNISKGTYAFERETDIEDTTDKIANININIDDIEEIDELNGDAGRFKFENVLKSMIARIELCGGLAPI